MGAVFAVAVAVLAFASAIGLWAYRHKMLLEAAYRGDLNSIDPKHDPQGWERQRLRRGRVRVAVVVIPLAVAVVAVIAGVLH
jgi:hypothetical protein